MAIRAKRCTIDLNPELHEVLRLKSVETSRSISELVNEAVRASLGKDAEDTAVFETRASELLVSYDEMVRRLKKEGRI